ncbi:MAG: hypothetical protein J0L73_01415 [Verrucomicrobia bacterium]|nr:hypothetical protein [Verrucomicrobiota bacterium]
MNKTSPRLGFVQQASAFLLMATHAWPLQAMTASTANSNEFERWFESGTDEVLRLAAPVPQLLFSPPPIADNFWLTGAELRPLQERLSFDGRLADLSGRPGVLDPVFGELLTTEGLLIIITERPFSPPPQGAFWFRRHPNRHYNPPDVSFWIKNLPAPSALRSIAFTLELLQEDGQWHWNTSRRFCSCY